MKANYNSIDLDSEIPECEGSEVQPVDKFVVNASILSFSRLFLIVAVSLAVIVLATFRESLKRTNDVITKSASLQEEEKTGSGLWGTYRDGYDSLPYFGTDSSTFLKYRFLKSFGGVLEPYSYMKLSLSDKTDFEDYDTLAFTVCPAESSSSDDCETGTFDVKERSSSKFKVKCSTYDEYKITILSDNDKAIDSFSAVCMYIRREIRSLTETDLETTLDAMATLWFTSEESGQEMYGKNFHNISYFTKAHYFAASHRNADHIHEGLGFLSQHLKLTNAFEVAIQAVDKSVTVPYWDFTIDNESPDDFMFQETTFGTISKPVSKSWQYRSDSILNARIPDGRWKDLKVETGNPFPDVIQTNVYGATRAPWNFNPSPYMSRFASSDFSLPSCKSYRKWMKITAREDFLQAADTYPHTGAHDSIGGQYGCDVFDFMTDKGWIDDSESLCFKWGTYMKDLWREHYVYPDDSCKPSGDVDKSTCGFLCYDDRVDDMLTEFKSIASGSFNTADMSDKDWSCMQRFICDGYSAKSFFGDQRESASCYDPSFWPIHPTLERGYHAKMLSGGFSGGDDWDVQEAICYRATCYNESGGEDAYTECCVGHNEDDKFPNFNSGVLTDEGVWMGNSDYLKASDPTRSDYEMPFIYDDFSWDHCGEEFPVDSLLVSLYDGSYIETDDSVSDRTLSPTPSAKTSRPTHVSLAPTPTIPTTPVSHTLAPTIVPRTSHPTFATTTEEPTPTPKTFRPTKPSSSTPAPSKTPSTHKPTSSPSSAKPTKKPTLKPTYSQDPSWSPTAAPSFMFQCEL